MSPLLNYLIAGLMVGYYVLIWITMVIYFNVDPLKIPPKASKQYPIYMHGKTWFHIHWISAGVAFGALIVRWIAVQLGGL